MKEVIISNKINSIKQLCKLVDKHRHMNTLILPTPNIAKISDEYRHYGYTLLDNAYNTDRPYIINGVQFKMIPKSNLLEIK